MKQKAPPTGSAVTGQRFGKGPRAIAGLVDRLTRTAMGKRGFGRAAIISHWAEIVGEATAGRTTPEKVSYPRHQPGNGTLHLRVADGAMAMEIAHMEPQLIERVNSYFGYRAVGRIRIVQAPLLADPDERTPGALPRPLNGVEEAALSDTLKDVDDPQLKEILENLGRSIIGRDKTGKKR